MDDTLEEEETYEPYLTDFYNINFSRRFKYNAQSWSLELPVKYGSYWNEYDVEGVVKKHLEDAIEKILEKIKWIEEEVKQ